jgi:hypothetical protein
MCIQEAIQKAVEGRYNTYQRNDASLLVQAQYFLDTSFWEALGHTLGWEGYFEYIPRQLCFAISDAHVILLGPTPSFG